MDIALAFRKGNPIEVRVQFARSKTPFPWKLLHNENT